MNAKIIAKGLAIWALSTLALSTLALSTPALAEPFSAELMVQLDRVGSPVLSADGKQLVYTVRKTDMEANKGRYNLWQTGTSDGLTRQLTSHEANDTDPAWSMDGKSIYFLSSRGGSSQLWRISTQGGEAKQASDLPLDIGSYKLTPDGRGAVVSLQVYLGCETLACTVKKDETIAESKTTGVGYDQLFMRHWDHWLNQKRSQLYYFSFEKSSEAMHLTPGVDADVPSRVWGGAEEYDIAPDGKTVYFAARLRNSTEPTSTNFDIYSAPMSGKGAVQNLSADNTAWDTQPLVSPDGKTLAYLAMSRPGFEADQFQLVLRDTGSGKTRVLSNDWDYSPSSLAFSPDSKTLYINTYDLGQKALWRTPVKRAAFQRVAWDGNISSFQVGQKHLVFARSDLKTPTELYRSNLNGKGQKQLTRFSAPQLADVSMGDYEQFSFTGAGGEKVYGFVVKPVGYQPGKQYPVAFLIHGGPQGSFGNNFHYRWNPQTYSGQGFASVFIDFHGSTGYGQAFTDSISGDWGGKPLEDLKLGLAAAVQRYNFLDSGRVCALGASYGGYMINWIAGNWSDRFACLVNHDGVFDNRMMYYATEELWFPEWEHGGPAFERAAAYEQHNPVNHVDQWRTPMLVVHGELDYRVPVTQGIAAFTALQRRGIRSRFLYFPDENHWVLKPTNSIQWHQEVNNWLHTFLNP